MQHAAAGEHEVRAAVQRAEREGVVSAAVGELCATRPLLLQLVPGLGAQFVRGMDRPGAPRPGRSRGMPCSRSDQRTSGCCSGRPRSTRARRCRDRGSLPVGIDPTERVLRDVRASRCCAQAAGRSCTRPWSACNVASSAGETCRSVTTRKSTSLCRSASPTANEPTRYTPHRFAGSAACTPRTSSASTRFRSENGVGSVKAWSGRHAPLAGSGRPSRSGSRGRPAHRRRPGDSRAARARRRRRATAIASSSAPSSVYTRWNAKPPAVAQAVVVRLLERTSRSAGRRGRACAAGSSTSARPASPPRSRGATRPRSSSIRMFATKRSSLPEPRGDQLRRVEQPHLEIAARRSSANSELALALHPPRRSRRHVKRRRRAVEDRPGGTPPRAP